MTTDAPAPAGIAVPASTPVARDYTVARLTRQRDAAEQFVDTLSARVAELERDKVELAAKLAEVTAEAAAPKAKKEAANG